MFWHRHAGLALTAIVVVGLALRLGLVLTHQNMLGVDGGAYLLSRNVVIGTETTGTVGPGLPRPPLAPGWQLVPFTAFLGDDVGFKVWSALASITPVLAVYLLAQRLIGRRLALVAAGFVSLDLWHAEMLVTGALPLLAFSLLGVAMWAVLAIIEWRQSWIPGVTLLVTIGLIPWVNQTTAGLAVLTLPIWTLALLWLYRSRHPWRARLRALALPVAAGSVIALGALPWYTAQLPGSELVRYPGPVVYLVTLADSGWLQFLAAAVVGGLLLTRASRPALRALGVLVIILGALTPLLSTDEAVINIMYRARYLLPMPLIIGAVYLLSRIPTRLPRLAVLAPVGALAVALLAGYVWQFGNQARYSDMATTDVLAALTELRDDGAVVSNAYTLSLWIAAVAHRPSPWVFTAEPPARWTADYAHVRCIMGWVPGCAVSEAAGALGATYVLVDTRFPSYNDRAPAIYLAPSDPWTVTEAAPWLRLVFQRGTTYLWQIRS